MKRTSNALKYSAEAVNDSRYFIGQVIARANTIEDIENITRRIMFANKIKEAQICENDGCTLVKNIIL